MNKKVYCEECLYFNGENMTDDTRCRCVHKNNIKKEATIETWRRASKMFDFSIKHPSEINKDNTCEWFEMKK